MTEWLNGSVNGIDLLLGFLAVALVFKLFAMLEEEERRLDDADWEADDSWIAGEEDPTRPT